MTSPVQANQTREIQAAPDEAGLYDLVILSPCGCKLNEKTAAFLTQEGLPCPIDQKPIEQFKKERDISLHSPAGFDEASTGGPKDPVACNNLLERTNWNLDPNQREFADKLREALDWSKEAEGFISSPQFSETSQPSKALMFFHLGEVSTAADDHNEAIQYFKKALPISSNPLAVYRAIGESYDSLKYYEKSLEAYQSGLEIAKENFGEDSFEFSTSLIKLASSYRNLEQSNEVEQLLNDALQIRRQLYGEESMEVAEVFIERSKGEKYIELSLNSIKLAEDIYLKLVENPQSQCFIDLERARANAYDRVDQIEEARACMQRCLDLNKEMYGEISVPVAMAHRWLGISFFEESQFQLAREHFTIEQKVASEIFPEVNPIVGDCLHNLGAVAASTDDIGLANTYYSQAVEMKRSLYDKHHPTLRFTLENYAKTLNRAQQFELALSVSQEACQISAFLKSKYPAIEKKYRLQEAASLHTLGRVYNFLNQHSESITQYRKAYEIRKNHWAGNNPGWLAMLEDYGRAYFNSNDFGNALVIYIEGLTHALQQGEHHIKAGLFHRNIGVCQEKMGIIQGENGAVANLVKAYNIHRLNNDLASAQEVEKILAKHNVQVQFGPPQKKRDCLVQ